MVLIVSGDVTLQIDTNVFHLQITSHITDWIFKWLSGHITQLCFSMFFNGSFLIDKQDFLHLGKI